MLKLRGNAIECARAFMDRAEAEGADTQVMPGYTHFQHAQPISVAFWMSHYAYAMTRDLRRLKSAYDCIVRRGRIHFAACFRAFVLFAPVPCQSASA